MSEAGVAVSAAPVLRDAGTVDAEALAALYNHYVAHTAVTFEETPVAPVDMAARLADNAAVGLPWLVAECDGEIAGYAYASKWKGRCAYRYAVESTVYLQPAAVGRGVGSRLYGALIDQLRERRLHTVIGGIALPNDASVRLHEKLGFVKVAQFRQVGFKFGRWIDVGYWQLML